jgi:hypothetical protein
MNKILAFLKMLFNGVLMILDDYMRTRMWQAQKMHWRTTTCV